MVPAISPSKIPVIYILSNGRSGSTLLDLMLGAHPEIWTLGEAQILPWEVRETWFPCGCGAPVTECEFWRPLLGRIPLDEGDYPIEFFREIANSAKVIRPAHLYAILRRKPSLRWKGAIEEYGRLNASYLVEVKRAAEERTGKPIRWLVDASKDVYRLFWLHHSNYFDLRVIHLMKDPRAFVYSLVRRFLPNARWRCIRLTGRWIGENWLFSHLCNDPDLEGKTFRLRYEDLAIAPEETMRVIGHWLAIEAMSDTYKNFRQSENHAIAGNPMRWQNSDIRLDDTWRFALPRNCAQFVWFVAGPLARAYGYEKKL